MKRICRGVALLGVLAALCTGLAGSAAHAETSRTVTLTPTTDAWYPTSPLCATNPVGCGSAPTTTSFPDNTLHVGASGGQEAARAYVSLSLGALPVGARITSGQLTLTVDPDAGSNVPETAVLQLCRVKSELSSPPPEDAPEVDCTVASPGSFLDETPAVFVFDLQPFLSAPTPTLTLAIVPTPVTAGAGLATNWHVATSSSERTGSEVPPVTAALDVAVPDAARPQPSDEVTDPVIGLGPPAEVPIGQLPGFEQPISVPLPPAPAPVAAPPAAAPVLPPAQPVTAAPAGFTLEGGQYGVFWSVPLLLAVIGWILVNLVRRDLRSFAARPAG